MASRQVTGREAEAAEDAISSHWTLVIVSWISHSLPPRPAGLGFVQARFPVSQILWLAERASHLLRLFMEGSLLSSSHLTRVC